MRTVGSGAVGTVGLSGATSGAQSDRVAGGDPRVVPAFAGEFVVSPLTAVVFPTAIRFGPVDGGFGQPGPGDDREDLYAATIDGDVLRFHLEWTAAGPVVRDRTVTADGFNLPLGIAFHRRGPPDHAQAEAPDDGKGPKGDALLVTDSRANQNTGRTDGVVVMVDDRGRRPIIAGLPNGRHNTNHLAFGPDDRLYVTNGNSTDDGCEGGDPEVFPYSGAILAVAVEDVEDEPAVLRWVDENGDRIPPEDVADHPVNAGFAEAVDVVARGFRNVFGISFGPDGVPHTAMNGADSPESPDAFYRLDEPEGTDYRYPYCFNVGPGGATGEDVRLEPNPAADELDCYVFADVDDPAELDCDETEHPTAEAIMGWHTCATGLDFPTEGRSAFPEGFRTDAFVGECGTFSPLKSADHTVASGDTRNTGHKVVHVPMAGGEAQGVRDFVTGLGLPTDVTFGPEGAMYIADVDALLRVHPVPG